MARPHILKKIAEERGVPYDTLVPQAIEQTGSILGAAMDLRVAPNTIQNWLETNNHEVVRTVVVKVRPVRKGKGVA